MISLPPLLNIISNPNSGNNEKNEQKTTEAAASSALKIFSNSVDPLNVKISKTLKIIILNQFEFLSFNQDKLLVHQVFVKLGNEKIPLRFFHQNWFEKPDSIPNESIFKNYDKVKIIYRSGKKNINLGKNLSKSFKDRVLKYLQEGRPDREYSSCNFFHHVQNVPTRLGSYNVEGWNKFDLDENFIPPEQGIVLKKKDPERYSVFAIGIGRNLTISIQGNGPLVVTSLKTIKDFYKANSVMGWNKRHIDEDVSKNILRLIKNYLGKKDFSCVNHSIITDEFWLRVQEKQKENSALFLDKNIRINPSGTLKMIISRCWIQLKRKSTKKILKMKEVFFQLDNGCELPSRFFHQEWFERQGDVSIFKKYNKIEIIILNNSNKFENISDLFSEEFKNKVLNFIKNGRDNLNKNPFSLNPQVMDSDKDDFQPGERVIVPRKPFFDTIYLRNGLFLTIFDRSPIVISDLKNIEALAKIDDRITDSEF